MTIKCVDSGTSYTSRIVGDPKEQVKDCINWLAMHLKSRYPKVLADAALAGQVTMSAAVLSHGEPETEDKASELWDKTLEEHQELIIKAIGLETDDDEEEEEGDAQTSYDMGFEECKIQIQAFVISYLAEGRPVDRLPEEIGAMEIQQSEDVKEEHRKEDDVESTLV